MNRLSSGEHDASGEIRSNSRGGRVRLPGVAGSAEEAGMPGSGRNAGPSHRLHRRSSSAMARTSAFPSLTSLARSRTCSGEVMTFSPDATRYP